LTPDTPVLLDTPAGVLRGQVAQGVACFRAVPYAAPPLGELRFAPPQPAAAWVGVRDATRPGPVAPQAPSRLSHVMGDFERAQSEDCLTLTVWAPAALSGARPVVVWLHGGAFMSGGGDLDWYDGARLASEGEVVVVAVNYRLGALGFLRAAGLCPGNLGLMDQLMAVQWVRHHIAAFGGDAQRITLMGQSAGGMSIGLLLARETPPPVQRAILMSAPLGLPPLAPAAADHIGEACVRAMGVDPQASDALAQLRRVPLGDVMRAHGAAARANAQARAEQGAPPGDAAPPFLPVADGSFLPVPEALAPALARAATRVDVLVGTTRDEARAFPGAPESMTREVFEEASAAWVDRAALAGRRAFYYRMDWAPPHSPLGAAHCIELPFVFGTASAFAGAPMLANGPRGQIDGLSQRMRAAWLAFVNTGNPATGAQPWPAVALASRPCLQWPPSPTL
jgi:para-nitrobenzyl esterase